MKKIISILICCLALTCSAVAAQAETEEEVQEKLMVFARDYLEDCTMRLRPNRSAPSISERDGKYVATFIELDLNSIQTELLHAQSNAFSYLAKLMYVEHTYEAVGETQDEALTADYQRTRSRRLTEIPRYSRGTWHN